MCGITGALAPEPLHDDTIARMAEAIHHRGPDSGGVWLSDDRRLGFGHRRLAIVDLSPLGHQPMTSNCGRFVLCYNGEVYNHLELRRELEQRAPRHWRGHSDTETLAEAIAEWGLAATLTRCVGMFALAVWDKANRTLALARDRFGEKPLYYGWVAGKFVFASELKALRTLPGFDNAIDRAALARLTARMYIPAPLSIYRQIYKLEPGCILTLAADATPPRDAPPLPDDAAGPLRIARYWDYRSVVATGLDRPIGDEAAALEELDQVLGTAIRGQAVADVPVGAFLSGGIDSSSIVALYRKHTTGNVRTFSIGFGEAGFDEAVYAKAVAARLGTDHHERYVTVQETQQVIPRLPAIYDEPFADSSQIPTFLVSAFAREQVTVALSGDGGDELFGGYNRYFAASQLWRAMARLPRPVRQAAGRGAGHVPPAVWNALTALAPSGRRPAFFGTKVQKVFRTMGRADGIEAVFGSFLDEWAGETSPVLGLSADQTAFPVQFDIGRDAPDPVRMMYNDAVSYLPDDILCKVDRAAMAVSLETRVPFLDHRVAELAARVPLDMKIRGGTGKHILRQSLYRELPREMFERPKAGFAIPVGEWMKGPLRDWAEALLDERRLRDDGYFDPAPIRRRWQEHLSGTRDATQAIWAVLMFNAWLDEQDRAGAR